MNLEEKITMLKEAKVIDGTELFARVQIIYSEFAQTVNVMIGSSYGAQGRDGYVGVCDNSLVLFENSVFGGKPKTEVFREPIEHVEFVSLKKTLFNIAKVLRVKVGGKKYKITANSKHKANLAKIAELLQK